MSAYYYHQRYPDDEKLVFTAGSESTGKPGTCVKNGRRGPCHGGHQGEDMDIRYMDSNGQPIQGANGSTDADVDRTNFLIDLFTGAIGFFGTRDEVYTGDQSKFGLPSTSLKTEKVHKNHLHVGMDERKQKTKSPRKTKKKK